MGNSEEWLSINGVINGLDSLETAAFLLDRNESTKWKWIAIAIHHSLYTFCVSSLELGNPSQVLIQGHVSDADKNCFMKKGNDTKWKKSKIQKVGSGSGYVIRREYTDDEPPKYLKKEGRKQKKEKLIGFWTALARIQDQEFWMGRHYNISAVSLTEEEWQNITWLTNQVRNDLIHFVPKTLLIHIGDIKRASLDAIRIIEFLCFESNAIYSIQDNWQIRTEKAIRSIRNNIQE